MLSDVLIIKMGQYIPLDPLTPLNGMMINYIIKRSCATYLWAWNLRLKIKQSTLIIACLKTASYPLGKCAQGSPHGIILVHINIKKIFRKPKAFISCTTHFSILCRDNMSKEKSNKAGSSVTSLLWESPSKVEEKGFSQLHWLELLGKQLLLLSQSLGLSGPVSETVALGMQDDRRGMQL